MQTETSPPWWRVRTVTPLLDRKTGGAGDGGVAERGNGVPGP
jgi:hypothetical protein